MHGFLGMGIWGVTQTGQRTVGKTARVSQCVGHTTVRLDTRGWIAASGNNELEQVRGHGETAMEGRFLGV